MRLSPTAIGILLGCGLTVAMLYAFTTIVPNETLGVRVRSGVAVGPGHLPPGVHVSVPRFHEVRVIKRYIHMSSFPLGEGKVASMAWQVVDGLRFHPLVADIPEAMETPAGESVIRPVLMAAWAAWGQGDAAGVVDRRDELNALLVPRHGIRVITLEIKSEGP